MNKTIRLTAKSEGGVAPVGEPSFPAWYDEFQTALAYASHLVCAGNVRDVYPSPDGVAGAFHSFEDTIWRLLVRRGVAALLVHDPVNGLRLHRRRRAGLEKILAEHGLIPQDPTARLTDLFEIQRKVSTFDDFPIALIVDYASHLGAPSDPALAEFFVAIHKTACPAVHHRPQTSASEPRFNPTIWIADRTGDLPDWFTFENAYLREISVELPDLEDRFAFIQRVGPAFCHEPAGAGGDTQEKLQRFALECDGETLQGMLQVVRIAHAEGLGLDGLSDALRVFRTGLRRNPWASNVLKTRIRSAPDRLGKRIMGQPHAIEKTLDILSRSIMGLSGVQNGRRFNRPRGVLFFAGPTGVGKTELANAVTELLFGQEGACQRFDMSEFMEEGSVTRLIGAPPGQPGHDRGGELVNAVRNRPFSVFLFDEIEKAHPRILDVFLQVLDEGRLTDARGATGHFSEALIIFTSNIGMFSGHKETNMGMDVMPSDAYRQLDSKVTQAVQNHFRFDLKRPELINRIGQNIVVFDFLRYASIARIFDSVLNRVIAVVGDEQGVRVSLSETAYDDLKTLCTHDPFEGGRGVGNRIETHFVNPLARTLFDAEFCADIHIDRIASESGHTELVVAESAALSRK